MLMFCRLDNCNSLLLGSPEYIIQKLQRVQNCAARLVAGQPRAAHIRPVLNPFAPGDFAEKRVLKLVEWFSGHCRAIKS